MQESGVRFVAQGESQLLKAIQNVDKTLEKVAKQAKASATSFEDLTASIKRASRIETLTDKIQIQNRNLELLQGKLKEASEKYGDTSEQAIKAQLAIDTLSASIRTNERAVAALRAEDQKARSALDEKRTALQGEKTALEDRRTALEKAIDAARQDATALEQHKAASEASATATKRMVDATDQVDDSANQASTAIRGLDRALEQSRAGFSAFEQIAIGAFRRVGEVAVNAMADAARGVASFVASSVKVSGDYEATLNEFAAVTGEALSDAGLSLRQFDSLALEMGAKTQFSAAQAAQAMVELAKGGMDPATIAAGGLEAALGLAAAGGLDLAKAAEITVKQTQVWKDNSLTAAQAADIMSQAANASTVSVEELGLGMANVGGVAQGIGADFDETVTTLAAISSGFGSASDAGTSLKTFFNQLQPTTKSAMEAMKELGIVTEDGANLFFDSTGAYLGNANAAELLKKATEGMSEAQKSATLEAAFGSDAQRAALEMSKLGADGINDMTIAMNKQGSATEQAAKRNQGFNFALESLLGSVENLQILIGKFLNPVLESLINTYLIPGANAAGEFFQALLEIPNAFPSIKRGGDAIEILPEMFESSAKKIDGIIARIAGKDFSRSFRGLLDSFSILGKKIGPDLQKLGAIISGGLGQSFGFLTTNILPAMSQAVLFVSQHWEAFKGALMGVGALLVGGALIGAIIAIGTALSALLTPIPLLISASAALGAAWNTNFLGIQETTATVWGYVTEAFNTAVGYLSGVFGPVITAFQTFGSGALQEIINFVTGTQTEFGNLSAIFSTVVGAVGTLLTDIVGAVILYYPQWIANWLQMAWAAANWVWNAIPVAISYLESFLGYLVTWVADNLPTWINNLLTWGVALAQWIADAIPPMIAKAGEFLQAIITWATTETKPTLEKEAESWGTILYDWVTKVLIPEIGPKLKEFQDAVVKALKKVADAAVEQAKKIATQIIDGIVNSLRDGINRVQNAIAELFGAAATSGEEATESHSPSLVFMRIGQNMINGLLQGLQTGNTLGALSGTFQTLITTAQSILGQWTMLLAKYGQEAWMWITRALPILRTQIQAWGSTLTTALGAGLPQWVMSLTPWSIEAWQWLQRSIVPLTGQMLAFNTLLQMWATSIVLVSLKAVATLWSQALYMWIPNELIPGIQPMWAEFLHDSVTNMRIIENEMYKSGKKVGSAIIKGTMEAIRDGKNKIINLFIEVINQAIAAAKRELGIASPSVVFYDIGQQIMHGLRDGIIDGTSAAAKAMTDATSALSGVVSIAVVPGSEIFGLKDTPIADRALNPNSVSTPATPGQIMYGGASTSNYSNTNNYNLTVNTPRTSQGVQNDFAVIRAYGG